MPLVPFNLDVLQSFRTAKTLRNHEPGSVITSLDFDDSGRFCLSAGTDESIQLYDCKTGTHSKSVLSKKYGAHLAHFTHRASNCVYASTKEQDTIRYLSLYDNSYIRYFKGHKNKVTGLEVSPIDDTIISAGLDRSVRIWDLRSPNCQGLLSVPTPAHVAFDSTGKVFAIASQDSHTVALYDVRNFHKEPFLSFSGVVDGSWRKVEFGNDGKYLVIASDTAPHGVFDSFTGDKACDLIGHESPSRSLPSVSPICFSPDGRFIFGCAGENRLAIWDLKNPGSKLTPSVLKECSSTPALVAFDPKAMLLATADAALNFWLPEQDS